jgi:hypothetical protein
MKVDGPNIGRYFIKATYEGIRIKDTIVKYSPKRLIEILEDLARDIYKESHIVLNRINFVQKNKMFVIISGTMEPKLNDGDEGVYINMRFYIDDNGNINSITIEEKT